MRSKSFFFFFFITLFFGNIAKIYAKPQQDTVKVGIFVNSIYDLKLADREYSMSFWVWMVYKNDSLNIADNLEVLRAKEVDARATTIEKINGMNWATANYVVTLQQAWNTDEFPFDKQTLRLRLEDSEYDSRRVIFMPDTAETKYDKNIDIQGFKITDFKIEKKITTYETTYGDPSLKGGKSEYSAVELVIEIRRMSDGLFWKLFLGLYIAFSISMLTFLVSANDLDARFGLCVGGLFAAVGNKYIVDSILPENSNFSLTDKIHALAFIGIFVIILLSAISRYYTKRDQEHIARIIDRISIFALPIIFFLLNYWFVKMV